MSCIEKINKTGKNQRKGIVFTLDAVFALYLFLIFSTAFVLLYETPTPATGEGVLLLSRVARDAYEAKYYSGSLPTLPNYKFNADCDNKKYVGSEDALYWAASKINVETVRVCMANE